MEASRSLGISYSKTMRKIVLPQATKLMLPNFVNQFVIALKDTTIVSAIGLVELFQTGKIIIARNYQSFKMYAILAVFYLVIITLLTRLAKTLRKEDSIMAKLKIDVDNLHKQYGKKQKSLKESQQNSMKEMLFVSLDLLVQVNQLSCVA